MSRVRCPDRISRPLRILTKCLSSSMLNSVADVVVRIMLVESNNEEDSTGGSKKRAEQFMSLLSFQKLSVLLLSDSDWVFL